MKVKDFGLKFQSVLSQLPTMGPQERTRQVTPMVQAWFAEFAEFVAFHKLALHCGLCRTDIVNAKRAFLHWGDCPGYRPPLGDTGGSTIIKTPTGSLWIGGRPQRTELRPGQIEWLRQAMDVLPHFQLGLHCQRCEADISGKNADDDQVYSAACRCTEYIGLNRDYREPAALVVM